MTPSNELYHFGIKGQKWGIRRFQNKSGGLTSAGRKHYDDGSESNSGSSGQSFKSRAKKDVTSRKFKIGAGITAGVAITTAATFVMAHNCKKRVLNLLEEMAGDNMSDIAEDAYDGIFDKYLNHKA